MKKLEDIPKRNIYQVPDGYFDKLPGILQSRVNKENRSALFAPYFAFAVRYAIPAVVILFAIVLWIYRPVAPKDAEGIIANVETEALIAYLAETEITTDEVLDVLTLTDVVIENIEDDVYFNLGIEDQEVIMEEIHTNGQ